MEKIYLHLTSGRGPRECAYVVARLVRVIDDEAQKAGIGFSLMNTEVADGPQPEALLSATILLQGPTAEAFVEMWLGTIQWIGTSPYRPKHKRKNWFIGVTRVSGPMVGRQSGGKIAIETMRAAGPGGQNVNKSNSAVRLTHVETGISVTARESRSQAQNKKLAQQKLESVFQLASDAETRAGADLKWAKHQRVERGNPVKIFHGIHFTAGHPKDHDGG